MQRISSLLPTAVTLLIGAALLLAGPISQPAHYHDFADQRIWCGLPHGQNVLSNAGFALVALWGWLRLWPLRHHPALHAGWPGYALFIGALFFTAFGSAYYHLAPDNARLLWDRLPIALACAGLLAAVRAETHEQAQSLIVTLLLAAAAVASIVWWHVSGLLGADDLRPYLMLQLLPVVLIPIWQTVHPTAPADRAAYAWAIALYLLAKLAELFDQALFELLGATGGHALKHLLATAAAWVILRRLLQRTRQA